MARKKPTSSAASIVDSRFPGYWNQWNDWQKWRVTFRGGEDFRNKYLEMFTTREDPQEFQLRKKLSPIPPVAKSAITDIRNSIFQRMPDISRVGGSDAWRKAINGLNGGVDRHGSTINSFLGLKVLEEILVMGRCGIYIDNSPIVGQTLADVENATPYLTSYQIEDVLSWSQSDPDHPSDFQSLLLRDTVLQYDQRTRLPMREFKRFRLLWIEDGQVRHQFYDKDGVEVDRNGNRAGPVALELTRIPFVMCDLGDSLLRDAAEYQITLMNMLSRAVWYDLQSNFPFYTEARDLRSAGSHLKQAANADGTATAGGQGAADNAIRVGAMHGRAFPTGAERPEFIAPPTEPLQTSLQFQDKLEADVRKAVNLAVQTMATRESAESKSLDNQGLEAGLSFIGSVLEQTERNISNHVAAYENKESSKRQIATIKYPDRYSLKTDNDRIDEAGKLAKLIFSVPTREGKVEVFKLIVSTLLGGRVNIQRIDKIHKEIEKSEYLTSDPDVIIASCEAYLCDAKTGSEALGFAGGVAKKAQTEKVEHAKEIAELQGVNDPAARGVPELSADPKAGTKEKQNTPKRGKARGSRVSGEAK